MRSGGPENVVLLYWQQLELPEINAAKIVEFFGVTVRFVDFEKEVLSGKGTVDQIIPVGGCVIVRARTLSEASQHDLGRKWLQDLTHIKAHFLCFGFEAIPSHNEILRTITSHGLLSAAPLGSGDSRFVVAGNSRSLCRHFTGLTIDGATPVFDLVFVKGAHATSCSSIIQIGEQPFFVRVERPAYELLLLACQEMADVNAPVARGTPLIEFFSRLAPLLMFLGRAVGTRLWHNVTPQACFILDDPLLKEHYGFLEYEKLLHIMQRNNFCTSIAFIPWNYRRSSPRIIELFEKYPDKYSLCVHGCDHINREFGTTDYSSARVRAQKGLERMRKHAQLTGLPFDDVMVFPQGVFSTVAVSALKSCGYLAAVNSTPFPTDVARNTIELGQLLEVARTDLSDFPLFIRRYPKDLTGLAFDLFLGKQALLVEHHDYFRNGYDELAETIEKLHSMEPHLQWTGLSQLCSQACWQRTVDNGDIEVRFYTDRFVFRNRSSATQTYVFVRRQLEVVPLASVTMDGRHINDSPDAPPLRIPVSLEPNQSAEVRIQRTILDKPTTADRPQANVFVRRFFSEFRDNYLTKSLFLTRLSVRIRNRLVRA